MATKRARSMLVLIRDNLEQGLDTLTDARQFVRRIGVYLSEPERLFLNSTLRNMAHLRKKSSMRRERGP